MTAEQPLDISDGTSPQVTAFTTVFRTRDSVGVALNHLWNMDFQRHEESGLITALWTGHADENANNPDHQPGSARDIQGHHL